jgi:hypothetical protein
MHDMRALLVLSAAGGLALYQMTSLVLGPAGSRELHLSLAIPTVDADELSDLLRPSVDQVLGMAVAATPIPSTTASRPALHRAAQPRPTVAAVAPPIIATTPALPVPSEPAARHRQGHAQPPKQDDID